MLSPQALKGIERNPEMDKAVLETELQNSDDSIMPLTCPRCKISMKKKDAPYGLDFKLDICKGCNLIWLDNGELEALQIAFEETPGGKDILERRRLMEEMSNERKEQLNKNISKARDYIPNDHNQYHTYRYGRRREGFSVLGWLVDSVFRF
jgi:Zn-finger nucleic acid-binding protein